MLTSEMRNINVITEYEPPIICNSIAGLFTPIIIHPMVKKININYSTYHSCNGYK